MSITLVSSDLRRAVIELHGVNCLRCHVQCTPDWWSPTSLHIDHVIPEAHGGPTTLANLQVLCRTCNLAKGATYADYRRVKPGKPGSDWPISLIAGWCMLCIVAAVIGVLPVAALAGLLGAVIWLGVCLAGIIVPTVILAAMDLRSATR